MKSLLRRLIGRLWRAVAGVPARRLHVRLAREYLHGHGLEVGALDKPLETPRHAKVSYVDRMSKADLLTHYPNLHAKKLVEVGIIDDGETLRTVADGSQDFVIACHFLEHCQDPIGTLGHFSRVLKPGGVLYMALPDKRFTFDAPRPITPLDHLWDDHENGPAASRREHYEEFVAAVEKLADPRAIQERADHYMKHDYSIHFHVWTQAEMMEFLLSVRDQHGWEFEQVRKHGEEVIFILRKLEMKASIRLAA